MITLETLKQDIVTLYMRGYIRHLDARCDEPLTVENLRAVLRDAGYSEAQIDARDYR